MVCCPTTADTLGSAAPNTVAFCASIAVRQRGDQTHVHVYTHAHDTSEFSLIGVGEIWEELPTTTSTLDEEKASLQKKQKDSLV